MKRNIILGVLLLSLIYCGSMFFGHVSAQKEVPDDSESQVAASPEVSTTLVLSQVNGGGGGTTGTYLFDYVEIKNVSGTPQSLNGLSLYYGSAVGQFASTASNAFALPDVSLNPGQYYLVQTGPTGTAGAAFPVTPDATTGNLTLSGTSGKVALVRGGAAGLDINICGATATPCSGAQLAFIVDWVAYGAAGNGTAGNGEGGTSVNNGVAITSSQGSVRRGGGCMDTDNNYNNFDVITAPVPRNTATPAATCGIGSPLSARFFSTRLNSAMEVPVNASTATGFGRVVLNDAENQITASVYYNNLTSGVTGGHIHGPAAVGVNTGVIFNMNPTLGQTSGAAIDRPFTVTPAQVADLKAGLWYFNVHTTNFTGGEIRGQILSGQPDAPSDFNGDGKTDFGLIRVTAGAGGRQARWYNLLNTASPTGQETDWGLDTDLPTPGDFDGDGRDDIAIWRSAGNNSSFFILQSATNTARVVRFGITNDDPSIVADYDGDGIDDPAIFRKGATPGAQSTFWWLGSNGAVNGRQVPVNWGVGADVAVPGDFNGDGKADFCIYRDVGGRGVFFVHPGTGGADALGADTATFFGNFLTDVVVPGDFDGDNKTDFSVTRAQGAAIVWYYLPSGGGPFVTQSWGRFEPDTEVQGDYDGDGRTDIAIWRSTNPSTFFILKSSGGEMYQRFGLSGDVPVAFDKHE